MKMKTILMAMWWVVMMFGMYACTPDRSTRIYNSSEALQTDKVVEGTIESIHPITIRKDETAVGTIGGAAIGGIAASTIGQGVGKDLASVGGAILGGLIGSLLEKGITDTQAWQIVVKLDSGQKVVVVQEADVNFEISERINLFTNRRHNTSRVAKL